MTYRGEIYINDKQRRELNFIKKIYLVVSSPGYVIVLLLPNMEIRIFISKPGIVEISSNHRMLRQEDCEFKVISRPEWGILYFVSKKENLCQKTEVQTYEYVSIMIKVLANVLKYYLGKVYFQETYQVEIFNSQHE